MTFKRRDLLGLEGVKAEEIGLILDTAQGMKEILGREIKKVPTLRGKTVVNLFYEPSTRTSTSFQLAAKYMSADTVSISTGRSSVVKGETLIDTARTLEVMGCDMVVMRHPIGGAPHFLARNLEAGVINAGDGMHEHPTQALLDMFTIREHLGRLEGLKIAIVGDVMHSRVARSNVWGMTAMGAEVFLSGPSTLLPPGLEGPGVTVTPYLEKAIDQADVVLVLRMQLERQKAGFVPTLREYSRLWGIGSKELALAKPGALLMHPGPMNRGVEIESEVADSEQSTVDEQVTNGVAVRMALLYLLLGGAEKDEVAN